MANGDTKTEALLNILGNGGDASEYQGCCNTKTQSYILDAIDRVQNVEDEVEELKNNPDVVDIVDTYADLQAYDTQHLTDNDIIRVLQDETHSGNSTYYRYNKSSDSWTFIGEVAAGGDTVYSNKSTSNSPTGGAVYIGNLDSSQVEQPDPTTTDNHNKYFWALPYDNSKKPSGYSVNIFGDITSTNDGYGSIAIGAGFAHSALVAGDGGIAMGMDATANFRCIALGVSADTGQSWGGSGYDIAIGNSAYTAETRNAINIASNTGSGYGVRHWASEGSIAIGCNSRIGNNSAGIKNAIAFGSYASPTRQGELNIGLVTDETTGGYNNTAYRVIGGVHDGQTLHDAATVAQGNTLGSSAPTTSTAGVIGQLYTDTTAGKIYHCTAIDTTDPNNPSYTWSEVGAGGGGGDTVYSTKTTSRYVDGGAVYIGNLDDQQVEQVDPTTTDHQYKYFWALPSGTSANERIPTDKSVNILGNAANKQGVTIGYDAGATLTNSNSVVIGYQTISTGNNNVSLGLRANAGGDEDICIGREAKIPSATYSVALGSYAQATRSGELNIGTGIQSYGYGGTKERVIGGVHDGVELHDAATVAQGNTLATSAPTTSTVGVLGQLYTDTTNMHTYQCTAISGSTYTWTQRW